MNCYRFNTATTSHDSHLNKSCTAIKQVLFGALLTTQPTEVADSIHIANILDGSLPEEGDNLSYRFESEAPWDSDFKSGESPSVGLISLIDIQRSDTFKNKIRSVCQRYKHCLCLAVQPLPACKVVPLALEVDRNYGRYHVTLVLLGCNLIPNSKKSNFK